MLVRRELTGHQRKNIPYFRGSGRLIL
jgi:hypothetical protein